MSKDRIRQCFSTNTMTKYTILKSMFQVNEEKRLIGLLHTLVRPGDRRATSLMNHVSVFFDEVLTRLENKGVRYNNIKFLYRDLNKPEVSSTLDTVLSDMNFTSDEVKDVRLIIELVHSRVRRKTKLVGAYELQCVETDSSFMQQEIKVFLQVRDEIDEPMRKVLKKIVASCYTESQEAKGDQNNNT